MRSSLITRNIHKDIKHKKSLRLSADKSYLNRGKFFFIFVLSLVLLTLLVYGTNLVVNYSLNLPPITQPFSRSLPESSIIYDDKGQVLYTIFNNQDRVYVPLSQIPRTMQMATLAAEDINFYSEDGINPVAIGRSLYYDLFKNGDANLQGASTITQQLVKYTSLTAQQTVARKVKEILVTLKITQVYSKDKILEAYLNAIPYGGTNYGIEAASRAYFNKDVGELDLAQSAFLAGLVQAPGIYSPIYSQNPNAMTYAKERQIYVLDQMLKYKNITGVTDEQIENAKNESLVFNQPQGIKYPSFVLYIRDMLYAKYGKDYVDTQGLRVYTTLDPKIQDIADSSVRNGVQKIVAEGLNAHNASLVAIDSTNGNILAMVGSADYSSSDPKVAGNINMAVFPVSPGSSVKPFVYITAFQHGMNPSTMLDDVKTTFNGNYTPMDFDNKFEGQIPLATALLQSRNIPAVEAANKVGIDNVYSNFLKAGMTDVSKCNYGLSLAIGACEVPLVQEVGAYSILSQDGINHPVRGILTVRDKFGNIIEDDTTIKSTQAFDQGLVKEVNSIIKNYSTLGPVKSAGWTVAGKTGTGQDNKNNLFLGYSSHLAVGVWSGNTDQSFTSNNTFGEDTAAPIWNDFMLQILPMFPENSSF